MRDALTTGIAGPNGPYLTEGLRQPSSQTSTHCFRGAAENAGGLWKSSVYLGTVVDFGTARIRKEFYSSRSGDCRRTWLFPQAISCLAGVVDFVTVLATGLLAYFTRRARLAAKGKAGTDSGPGSASAPEKRWLRTIRAGGSSPARDESTWR